MQSRIRHFANETICSCDPDSNTPSFALFVGREVLWVGKVAVEPVGLWLRQVACLARHSDLLVIEGQYLPANLPPREAIKRWPSVLTLIVARGEIQAQWKVLGKTAHVVQPGTWQRSLGATALGRERLKGLSRLKASDILQRTVTDHNIADAVNLGHWFIEERQWLEKLKSHAPTGTSPMSPSARPTAGRDRNAPRG
jgi:hypothetical protein